MLCVLSEENERARDAVLPSERRLRIAQYSLTPGDRGDDRITVVG